MGYNTRYVMVAPAEVIADLRAECEEAAYAITADGATADSVKWYEHETDCLALSSRHPSVLVELRGDGEEQGDAWRKYFQGGRVQVCRAAVAFEPFDPAKLR